MSSEELKLCPFCGSPAKSDNGFSPAESITYAWCSNTECQLHSVDVGMTPSDWNRRALPNVDPQPPTVSVTWHESPESVHRAMWEEVAVAEGMTYEQLIAESEGEGETETGETVAFTHEQELAGMRGQGCWAFVDTRNNTIHAWADEATPRELVLHMLAHEIGHITGEPHPDDMQEEMRAEQFGRVAKMAYGLLPARAQLAAIQGGMGEVVDVVAWAWDCLGPHVTVDAIQAAELQSISVKLEPLMTVAQHQRVTAAMAAEVEQLRAELDAIKGQEPVGYFVQPYTDRPQVIERVDDAYAEDEDVFPLYRLPPAKADEVIVPVEPSRELLMSMALRLDHGLGCPGYYDQPIFGSGVGVTHAQRLESALSDMRKVYEEVTGQGFYSPANAERYSAMLASGKEG